MDIAQLGMEVNSSDLRRARGEMEGFVRTGKRTEVAAKGVTASTDTMAAGMKRAALAVGGMVAALSAARAVLGATQQYTQLTNSLRAMGLSSADAASAMESIVQVANRTRAPLDATAKLYNRISIAGKDLGATQQQILRFTENVGLALAQSGTSANEASGALLQLSQAMAGGVVRAEEFNSILEGAFPIAQAAARGIDEAAGSVGRLRQLVIEGKISSDEFFNAILSQTDQLEAAFATTVPTIGQAFTVLNNNFVSLVGSMDQAIGVSEAIARALLAVGENLDRVVTYVGVAAAILGGRYVAGVIAAQVATMSFAGSLVFLRGALIRTGIGILIVGAGELAFQFSRLIKSAGSFGAAMGLLGDVAGAVWQGIIASAKAIPPALSGVWLSIKAGFLTMIADMQWAWRDFLQGMSVSMAGLSDMEIFGMRPFEGISDSLQDAANSAAKSSNDILASANRAATASSDAFAEAGAAVTDAFGPARAALDALKATVAGTSSETNGAAEAAAKLDKELSDLAGSGGGAGKAGKAVKDAADKVAGFDESIQDAIITAEEFGGETARVVISGVDSMANSWADFVMRGFSDFKGFVDGVLDSFKSMLSQMIAMAARNRILLSISAAGGGVAGTAASAGGLLGGGGGGLNLLGGGGGLIGGLLGTGGAGLAGLAGSGGLLGGVGSVASGLGGVLSGGGIGSSFANLGGLLSGSVGGLGAIGAALPAIGLIGGGIMAVASLFKKKKKTIDNGLFLLVDGLDSMVESFKRVKKSSIIGGSSKETFRREAEAAVADPILGLIEDLQDSLSGLAGGIGVEFDDILRQFSTEIKVSTFKMDDAEAQEALSAGLAEMSDQMAAQILAVADGFNIADRFETTMAEVTRPGSVGMGRDRMFALVTETVEQSIDRLEGYSSRFAREGETATQTLERLSLSLQAANPMLRLLNQTMFEVSIAGADMASSLADAFGGIEAMQAASQQYYDLFFTDAEKLANLIRETEAAFDSINATMPKTRAEYRALVEAQDLTTQSGRETYAALVGLAGAMNEILPAVENFTREIEALVGGITTDVDGMIAQAASAQRESAQAASLWYRTSQTLRAFIADLRGTAGALVTGAQAQAFSEMRFQTLLSSAISGDNEAAGDLPRAARALLDSSRAQARTRVEAARMEARVLNDLQLAAGVADVEGARHDVISGLLGNQVDLLTEVRDYLTGGGALDPDQIDALSAQLGNLQAGIEAAEMINYAFLKERLAVTVDLLATADLPADVRRLIANAQNGVEGTIDFVVRSDLTPDQKWLALTGSSELIKTIDLVLGKDLPSATRTLALVNVSEATRTINLVTGTTLPEDEMRLALAQSSELARIVNVTLTYADNIGAQEQAMLLLQTTTAQRILYGISNMRAFSVEGKALLMTEAGSADRVSRTLFGISNLNAFSEEGRALIRANSGDSLGDVIRTLFGVSNLKAFSEEGKELLRANGTLASLHRTLFGVSNLNAFSQEGRDLLTTSESRMDDIYRTLFGVSNLKAFSDEGRDLLMIDDSRLSHLYRTLFGISNLNAFSGEGRDLLNIEQSRLDDIYRTLFGVSNLNAFSPEGIDLLNIKGERLAHIYRTLFGVSNLNAFSEEGRDLLMQPGGTLDAVKRTLFGTSNLNAFSEEGRALIRAGAGNSMGDVLRTLFGVSNLNAFSEEGKELLRQNGTLDALRRTLFGVSNLNAFSPEGKDLLMQDGVLSDLRRTLFGISNLNAFSTDGKKLLAATTEQITKTLRGAVDMSGLTAEQRALFEAATTTTPGTIKLAGQFTYDPTAALESSFNPVITGMDGLRGSLTSLTDTLRSIEAERKASEAADAKRAEAFAKIQKQAMEAEAWQRTAADNARGLIQQVRQLEQETGVTLKNGSGAAVLEVTDQGRVEFLATHANYTTKAGLDAFDAAFWQAGGLQDQIGAKQSVAGKVDTILQGLREQALALGMVPGFAGGGMHTGGLRVVGEHGPEIEATGPARIYSASQTRSMLGGNQGEVVRAIHDLKDEVERLRDENRQLQMQTVKYAKRNSDSARKAEVIGLPVVPAEGASEW